LLIIDYVQLVGSAKGINERRLQVENVSERLRDLAIEYNIAVIAISSLNRAGSSEDVRPTTTSLRESSELEFEADVILLCTGSSGRGRPNVRWPSSGMENRGSSTCCSSESSPRSTRASPVAKTRVDDTDLTVGVLPLMGKAYWIARAAEPGADRVGSDFTLAPFPRRGESEVIVTPARASASPRRQKSRGRSRAA